MRKAIVGLLICCSIGIQAQNNAIQNALKNYDYEQAIKLISKEREIPEMDLLKAKCFKNIALYNDAIVLLEELVKHDISNNSAVNELADCYQSTGNFRKSKLYYFMALQSNPTNRFAQINYLNINYKLKEWKQTIQLAHSILEKDSLPFLFPVLGDCFAQLSKTDSAIYYYKKGVISNPEDYNTLSKLSGIYLHANKYTDLINSTNRFILSDSSNQVINQYNGIGLCLNKNYERAIYRLNKLFQQGDSSFLTNYYLGASYFAIQDYISAFDQLNRAYNKDSSNIGMYYYFGKSAIFSGHQQKGIQVLSKGLTMLIPNDSVLFNYYYNISQAYNRLNIPTEEIKYLKLCCQCLPSYRLGLYTIGSIYDNALKKPEEAMKYYNLFMATRKNAKVDSTNSSQTASYYNATQARMNELKEEPEQTKTKH